MPSTLTPEALSAIADPEFDAYFQKNLDTLARVHPARLVRQLAARLMLATTAATPPPDVGTSKGWHAPGLGEVHSADHKLMVYCEQEEGTDGDMIVSDALAKRICLALSQPVGDAA